MQSGKLCLHLLAVHSHKSSMCTHIAPKHLHLSYMQIYCHTSVCVCVCMHAKWYMQLLHTLQNSLYNFMQIICNFYWHLFHVLFLLYLHLLNAFFCLIDFYDFAIALKRFKYIKSWAAYIAYNVVVVFMQLI